MTEPIYIPTSSLLEFPFTHILITTCYFVFFIIAKCEVIYHYGFDLHFPNLDDVEHHFMCLYVGHPFMAIFMAIYFGKNIYIYIFWPVQFLAGLWGFFLGGVAVFHYTAV